MAYIPHPYGRGVLAPLKSFIIKIMPGGQSPDIPKPLAKEIATLGEVVEGLKSGTIRITQEAVNTTIRRTIQQITESDDLIEASQAIIIFFESLKELEESNPELLPEETISITTFYSSQPEEPIWTSSAEEIHAPIFYQMNVYTLSTEHQTIRFPLITKWTPSGSTQMDSTKNTIETLQRSLIYKSLSESEEIDFYMFCIYLLKIQYPLSEFSEFIELINKRINQSYEQGSEALLFFLLQLALNEEIPAFPTQLLKIQTIHTQATEDDTWYRAIIYSGDICKPSTQDTFFILTSNLTENSSSSSDTGHILNRFNNSDPKKLAAIQTGDLSTVPTGDLHDLIRKQFLILQATKKT